MRNCTDTPKSLGELFEHADICICCSDLLTDPAVEALEQARWREFSEAS